MPQVAAIAATCVSLACASGAAESVPRTSQPPAFTRGIERPVAPVRLLYLPALVSDGEPLYVHVACLPAAVKAATVAGRPADFDASAHGEQGAEIIVPAPGAGPVEIAAGGFRYRLLLAGTLVELAGCSFDPAGRLRRAGDYVVLRHRPIVIKESRRWYLLRKLAERLEGRRLPDKVLLLRPAERLELLAEGVRKGCHRFTQLALDCNGRSPLLAMIAALASEQAMLARAAEGAGVLLLLPAGEWNGGLDPETYRRAVEWLLDALITAGAERIVLAGPAEFGPLPELASLYRTAAAAAASSRRASYIATDGLVAEDDFRQGPDGPYTERLGEAAQRRLLEALLDCLKTAKTLHNDRE